VTGQESEFRWSNRLRTPICIKCWEEEDLWLVIKEENVKINK